MIRFYLMPMEQVGMFRGPKYLRWRQNPGGLSVRWNGMDYGKIDVMLVRAKVSQSEHGYLAAQQDVVSVPEDIDGSISVGALAGVKASLEGLYLPGGWISVGVSYRQVLRVVAGIFQLAQRYHGRAGAKLFELGIGLDTQWAALPVGVKQSLRASAEDLGFDTSGVTAESTMRQILKMMADQWGEAFIFGDGRL